MISALGDTVSGAGATTGVVTTKTTGLNLRAAASPDARVLQEIPKGAVVQILGRTLSWFQVSYNGQTGYASRSYITETPFVPPAIAQAATPTGIPALTQTVADSTGLTAANAAQGYNLSLMDKLSMYFDGQELTSPRVLGSAAAVSIGAFLLYKYAPLLVMKNRKSF